MHNGVTICKLWSLITLEVYNQRRLFSVTLDLYNSYSIHWKSHTIVNLFYLTVYACSLFYWCYCNPVYNFHELVPGASRARSKWQSFQQTRHGVLCLLIDRWVYLKVNSTTKILTQKPGCLDTAVAQDSHRNDKNDDNGAEVHSYNLQKSWKNIVMDIFYIIW